jgi:carboxyl-terminal processing protease
LLTVSFLAGMAARPTCSLIAERFADALSINVALAQDSDRAETYRLLALFGDVFGRVHSDYVDPVSDKELVENVIDGMLTHSACEF